MSRRARSDRVPRSVGLAVVLALSLTPAAPVAAQEGPRTAMDDDWHFSVAPYFWFASLEGTVSMKGIAEVPVKATFSDIWDNLDMALLLRFEGRKYRWGFGAEVVYLNLGASVASDRPILGQRGLEADLRQVISEGFGTYRVVYNDTGGYLDLLAGVRYTGTSSRLAGTNRQGIDIESTKRTLDWLDGMGGLRFRAPLGSRVGLTGRGDVAGFGSDVTWNLQGGLDVVLSERWLLGAGYRYLDIDYDKGETAERKLYKVAYNGPNVFVAYSW